MEGSIGKRLKKQFDRQLRDKFPQFCAVTDHALRNFGRVFRWQVSPSCHVFLLLLLSRRENEFTIEIAWNGDAEFPSALLVMNPIDMPQFQLRRDVPRDGRFRFRLAGLFHPRGEYWWPASNRKQCNDWVMSGSGPKSADATDDDTTILEKSVASAMEAIEKYGMPYLAGCLRLADEPR